MAAAPHSKRTTKRARARGKDDWRPRFLEAFDELLTVSHACRAAKVSRRNVYDERDRNEAFKEAWDEIAERSTEDMEREAYRRAVDGWRERAIFDDDGNELGEVRKFSDTLLIFMLKARRPDVYREHHRLEHTGPQGGPIAAEIVTVDAKEAADAAHDFLSRITPG